MKWLWLVALLMWCGGPGSRAQANELQSLADIVAEITGQRTGVADSHSEVRDLIDLVAGEEGLNPAFLRALVACESDYDPQAVSHAGAIGLCQLMPRTALELDVNPYDLQDNLKGGSRYIITLIRKYQDVRKALWAYNAGPTRVDAGGRLPLETREYANKVLALYWKFERETE